MQDCKRAKAEDVKPHRDGDCQNWKNYRIGGDEGIKSGFQFAEDFVLKMFFVSLISLVYFGNRFVNFQLKKVLTHSNLYI